MRNKSAFMILFSLEKKKEMIILYIFFVLKIPKGRKRKREKKRWDVYTSHLALVQIFTKMSGFEKRKGKKKH